MPPNAPSPNSKDLEAPRRSKRARKPPNRPEAMLLDSKNQKRALSTLVPKTASRAPSKPHPPRKVSLESQGDCPAMSVEPTVKKQRTVSPLTPSSSASRNSTRRTRTPAKVDTPKISNKKRSAVPFVSKRFRTKPPPQKGALQNLTQAMMRYIQDAPNQVLRVPVASEDLGVPKRRIYDVLHVMEGAGLVEPFNNGHGKNQNDYRWIHNMNKRHRMEPPSPEFALVQKLEAEEKELDHWIAMLKIDAHSRLHPDPIDRYNHGLYISSGQLKRHLYHHHAKDSSRQFVAVALNQDDVVQEVEPEFGHAEGFERQMMICPPTSEPWEWADVPEGFHIKGPDKPLGYVAFAPPPPMLGCLDKAPGLVEGTPATLGALGVPCTSDFSATALMGLSATTIAQRNTSLGTWSSKEEERHESPRVSWGAHEEEQDLGLIPLLLRASSLAKIGAA